MGNALETFVENSRRLFILTGAGCSTNSGIPDYRDTDGSWTQNVDRLHQAAGSRVVIDLLHGLLGCPTPRRLSGRSGPTWADLDAAALPAGDAEIDHVQFRFVQEAPSRGIPIAAVNIGRLRSRTAARPLYRFLL
jgi:hypothetical protein